MSENRRSVLIVGGSSDIGRAIARRYAQEGWDIVLTARDPGALAADAADLQVRSGSAPQTMFLDLLDTQSFPTFLQSLKGLPDTAICVAGQLGEHTAMETDLAAAQANLRTNFEGPALLLLLLADGFAKRGSGTLIGISSVAGDRGRASNYIYGSSKAGFSQFLSGLRARLRRKGVHVATVKPGFVRTAMTSGMKLPPLLTAEPHEVADAVFARGQNGGASVIYVRRIWQLIMFIIRALPEPLFVRLGL